MACLWFLVGNFFCDSYANEPGKSLSEEESA